MTKMEDILTEDYVVRCFTARAEYIALAKLSHSFEILLVEFPVISVKMHFKSEPSVYVSGIVVWSH